MSELEFSAKWEASELPDPRERATFSSLTLTAGPEHVPVTEVHDVLASTVRDSIRVPLYPVARWLLINWWRLRWEPRPQSPAIDWLQAHSLATISSDYAWPAISFASDGTFVRIDGRAEPIADVATIRYLRPIDVQIPAHDFERFIDQVVSLVDARVASLLPEERELAELVAELNEERSSATLSRDCRLQALAGIDAGAADEAWLQAARRLADFAGPTTGEEVVAVSSQFREGIAATERAVDAIKNSPVTIKLARLLSNDVIDAAEPWQRGRRLAIALRSQLGVPSGPLGNAVLESLIGAHLPVRAAAGVDRTLVGGFRNGITGGRTAVIVPSARLESQRFYLSRILGASIIATDADHVLPVSVARTAFQKTQRTFAQEFLCPWADLDVYTDENGSDPEAITAAAEHFGVSEYVVLTALVNNEKIARSRLPDDVT